MDRKENVMVSLESILHIKDGSRSNHLVSLYELSKTLPSHATVVEIGCYRGDSVLAIAGALHGSGSLTYSFDPIFKTGKITYPDMFAGSHTLETDLDKIVGKMIQVGIDPGDVIILPYTSEEALAWWRASNGERCDIDMVFVDGEHTPEAVAIDCGWLDFVKPGGIAVFDDWAAPLSTTVNSIVQQRGNWLMEYDSCTPQGPITHMTYFRRMS